MRSLNNGINTPVSSLRSASSGGIGEFLDLIPLIDWAASCGFNIIQILPINDSGNDPSPYNLQSAFALNPILIRWPNFDSKGLNDLPRVDYAAVLELKNIESKNFSLPENEINAFMEKFPWVKDYAVHREGRKSIQEQILCYRQMKEVKAHADQKGIKLIGDLPILIAPDSTDVKINPHLFRVDYSAGAPPDLYSDQGQDWGFPLYDWKAIEGENFLWWRNRIAYAGEFYHYFRIDHIVGFYRIWAKPLKIDPQTSSFHPYKEEEWIPHGEKILNSILEASTMLPIGEDLGVVPTEVRESLQRLKIPGTKVLRWERNWSGDGSIIPFSSYPVNSMATVSTHDSTPLRLWWNESEIERKIWSEFEGWELSPSLNHDQIQTLLKQSHHTTCDMAVNLLLEYLSMVDELCWADCKFDRINVPGVRSELNWTWRMKPTLVEMSQNNELNRRIKDILN